MADETATKDKVVCIHYVLRDEEGNVSDTSYGRDPLAYLHGHDNIVSGLEKELEGKTVGDHVQVTVAPEEGYGLRSGPGPQRIRVRDLPRGVEPLVGNSFAAQSSDGTEVPLWIVRVENNKVWVDTNHPLAGTTLDFDVTIVRIRDATPEELQHGHAHGVSGMHGHQH